jgi:hypothetical protein
MKKTHLLPLFFILFANSLYADTIELSNGKTMEGTFIGREGDAVKFEVDGISMVFQANDVKNIQIGSASATQNKVSEKSTDSASAEIAAGTTLTIRLSDVLDSGRHSTGHKFAAVLEGALVANGVTVAPANSKVYGTVTESVKARRLAGQAKLMITLTGIQLDGQIMPITTDGINALTQPTGASTVGKTARGAAIGALVDGSEGAKTGAKVGLGAAVLSRGNQVVIPSGTLLDFKLTQPLTKNK